MQGRGRGRPRKQQKKDLNEEDNQPQKERSPEVQERKVGRPKKHKIDHNSKASTSSNYSPILDPILENSREMEDSDLAQFLSRDHPHTLAHENSGEEEDNDYVRDPVQIACTLTFENSEELDVAEMSLCNNGNQSQPEDYGYEVKAEFMPTLRKIINKHGNIAKRCGTMLATDRSNLLEMVCKTLHDIQKMCLTNVTKHFVESKIDFVQRLHKGMGLDLDWLHISLTELLEAIEIRDNIGILQRERDNSNKHFEKANSELKDLQKEENEVKEKIDKLTKDLNDICAKKTTWEANLAATKNDYTLKSQKFKDCTSKINRFIPSLMDGLI